MITAHSKSTYGHSQAEWSRAKEEAIFALRRVARDRRDIPYSDLVAKIDSISFLPEEHKFHDFLGQISIDEDAGGRGMLSVLVVHKTGDRMPGPGFFELARSLGRAFDDKAVFWSQETQNVHDFWSQK